MNMKRTNQLKVKPVSEIAQNLGINPVALEEYGPYKAKVKFDQLLEERKLRGKLIMVTAMSPTPAGEGKTTTSIGLVDAFNRLFFPATRLIFILRGISMRFPPLIIF